MDEVPLPLHGLPPHADVKAALEVLNFDIDSFEMLLLSFFFRKVNKCIKVPVAKISSLSIELKRKAVMESIDVKIEGPYHDGDGEVEGHHGAQDGHHVVRLHELDIALVFGNLKSNKNIYKILLIKIF